MVASSRLFAVVLLVSAVLAPVARAHHSSSMYDATKQETVTGAVKAFNWTNPHITLELVAEAGVLPAGVWMFEASSPGVMTRAGWDKRVMKPGDKVTVTFSPLRDGRYGGSLRQIILANGMTLVWARRA